VNRLNRSRVTPLDGVAQGNRCGKCKRFARLWPGERECDRCRGVLPLVYVSGAEAGRGEAR
jgi:hypothetical protein